MLNGGGSDTQPDRIPRSAHRSLVMRLRQIIIDAILPISIRALRRLELVMRIDNFLVIDTER